MPPVLVVSLALSPVIYLTGRWLTAVARVVALAALGILWFVFWTLSREFSASGTLVYSQGAVSFYFDGLSFLLTAAALFLSTMVVLFSTADMRGRVGEEKYYTLLLLTTGAVIGLVSAGDLFNLWVWFELTVITSYLLVSFYRERTASLAACAKFLIQTATGSILILFAVALVFAHSGTLDLADLRLSASPLTVVAGAFFIIGFGVKLGLAPTYTWLPDAYSEAPSGVTALLSGVVTVSGMIGLLRALAFFGDQHVELGAVLIGYGTVSIVTGNLLAIKQDQVKRIFAYSSISHIGFLLLGVGIGVYAGERMGFQAGMLQLLANCFSKGLAFLAVGAVIHTLPRGDASLRVGDLAGLSKRDPLVAIALVIACLSLVGMPPLVGFMSKWQILSAGLAVGSTALNSLMVFAALNSVFSLAYCLPIINALFRADPGSPTRSTPLSMRLPIVILAGIVIVAGVFPGLLDWLVMPATQALMMNFTGLP